MLIDHGGRLKCILLKVTLAVDSELKFDRKAAQPPDFEENTFSDQPYHIYESEVKKLSCSYSIRLSGTEKKWLKFLVPGVYFSLDAKFTSQSHIDSGEIVANRASRIKIKEKGQKGKRFRMNMCKGRKPAAMKSLMLYHPSSSRHDKAHLVAPKPERNS
ncbi:hypothetical protein Patl1_36512 [Pistacia atlantica]|nr:hypothetical protein Patl1_36512 [Pistacia atlantica]